MDLLNLRRICLIFEGVEADEPAWSQASHSKVTKVSLVMAGRAFSKLCRSAFARNSKPQAVEDLGRSTTQRRSWPG